MVCGENWNEIVNIQKLSLSSRRDWSNQSHLFVGELDKESQKVSCCEPAVPQNRLSNIWEIFRYFQNLKEIRNKIQENNRASIWKTISIKCNFSLFLRSQPFFYQLYLCIDLVLSCKVVWNSWKKLWQKSLKILFLYYTFNRSWRGILLGSLDGQSCLSTNIQESLKIWGLVIQA